MAADVKDILRILFDENGNVRRAIVVFSIVMFWLFAGWTLGILPAFGAGFARAETMNRVEANQIESSILNRRIRYCSAPVGSETSLFFLKSVNEKLKEYFQLTSLSYNLPTCPELVYVPD